MKGYRTRFVVLNEGPIKSISRINHQNELLKLGPRQKSLVLCFASFNRRFMMYIKILLWP